MRTLIFALILLCSVPVVRQNVVNNNTQWNLDKFVNDCLKELKIDTCSINIHSYKGLIYRQFKAVTYNSGGLYIIALSDEISLYSEAKDAVRHELKHISQLLNKELIQLNSDTVIFKGIKYKSALYSQYNSKWETEARNF